MNVLKLNECGYEESALGFSLSYNSTIDRAKELFPTYAFKGNGESKFLESIYIWVDVNAPRFWWSEADTYRLSTKQSSSTMHSLGKTKLTNDDFEYPVENSYLEFINTYIQIYHNARDNRVVGENLFNYVLALKSMLPEGFLQRRIWCMSYKTLQNIYNQRKNHRLPQWRMFLDRLISQLDHPEFIVQKNETNETSSSKI